MKMKRRQERTGCTTCLTSEIGIELFVDILKAQTSER